MRVRAREREKTRKTYVFAFPRNVGRNLIDIEHRGTEVISIARLITHERERHKYLTRFNRRPVNICAGVARSIDTRERSVFGILRKRTYLRNGIICHVNTDSEFAPERKDPRRRTGRSTDIRLHVPLNSKRRDLRKFNFNGARTSFSTNPSGHDYGDA